MPIAQGLGFCTEAAHLHNLVVPVIMLLFRKINGECDVHHTLAFPEYKRMLFCAHLRHTEKQIKQRFRWIYRRKAVAGPVGEVQECE